MRYRKKPVVVEAWQWDGNFLEDCKDVPQWLYEAEERGDVEAYADWYNAEESFMEIETLEGTHIAKPGDYIIKGIQGELYPCKPDIFEQTYEEVADE